MNNRQDQCADRLYYVTHDHVEAMTLADRIVAAA